MKRLISNNRRLCSTTGYFLASLLLVLTMMPVVGLQAQGADTQPPIIEVEELSDVDASATQIFTAQIAEDRELRDATLYYRRAGQVPYTAVPMVAIAGSDYFSATIDTDPTDLRAFEYYVQARDMGGNRTVNGYAFEPIVRNLVAVDIPVSTTAPGTPATGDGRQAADNAGSGEPLLRDRRRFWQVALGVVAVGALIALSSGSDSGSSNGSGETVPLTINLEEL